MSIDKVVTLPSLRNIIQGHGIAGDGIQGTSRRTCSHFKRSGLDKQMETGIPKFFYLLQMRQNWVIRVMEGKGKENLNLISAIISSLKPALSFSFGLIVWAPDVLRMFAFIVANVSVFKLATRLSSSVTPDLITHSVPLNSHNPLDVKHSLGLHKHCVLSMSREQELMGVLGGCCGEFEITTSSTKSTLKFKVVNKIDQDW